MCYHFEPGLWTDQQPLMAVPLAGQPLRHSLTHHPYLMSHSFISFVTAEEDPQIEMSCTCYDRSSLTYLFMMTTQQ